MFDRGQEIQDEAVKIISNSLLSIGQSNFKILFHPLDNTRFY